MTPDDLRAWLDRLNISQSEAARRLGISRNTINMYLAGRWEIPRIFELACKALEEK